MWRDPIVDEVRTIRETYAKQFEYDLDAIYRDLKAQETRGTWNFVSLPPKRVQPVTQMPSVHEPSETA